MAWQSKNWGPASVRYGQLGWDEPGFTAQFRHYRSEGVVEAPILSDDRDGKVNFLGSEMIISRMSWGVFGEVQESSKRRILKSDYSVRFSSGGYHALHTSDLPLYGSEYTGVGITIIERTLG